jgi:hypothetical protein
LAEGLCGDPFAVAKPFFLEGHRAEIGKHASTISRELELVAPVIIAFFWWRPMKRERW